MKKGPRTRIRGKRRRREKRALLPTLIKKVNSLIVHSAQERGAQSEEHVVVVAEVLKKRGEIINYYPTYLVRKLDKRGVDIILESRNGFYLNQVKSSITGAEKHRIAQLESKLLIYGITRFPGQNLRVTIKEIKEILENEPSFVRLPDWITKVLGAEKERTTKKEKTKKRIKIFDAPGVRLPKPKHPTLDGSKEEIPVLKLADVLETFKGVAGVDRVRIVCRPESSLAKKHIEVVCWAKGEIYLFDIHREDLLEEKDLRIFPLNLKWPKEKIEGMLKEEPMKLFPLQIYGAIMDLD